MTIGRAFGILRIPPTDDQSSIQHAFALRSREAHPEENPEGWRELVQAYQVCMNYAKDKSRTEPDQESGPHTDSKSDQEPEPYTDSKFNQETNVNSDPDGIREPAGHIQEGPSQGEDTDYYREFKELDRMQEMKERIEKPLISLLDQLEGEKFIKNLDEYSLVLGQFSRLSPFAIDDPLPYRVCSVFCAAMEKKKRLFFFRKKMLQLLSGYSDVLNQADEVIMTQQTEGVIAARRSGEVIVSQGSAGEITPGTFSRMRASQPPKKSFAGLRMLLTSIAVPRLVWYFLVFVWVVRYFLTPVFAIATPIVSQLPDGTVHYVTYREDLPEGTYVRASLREAHWVGMGYYMTSDRLNSGAIKIKVNTYHQYLFLQAVKTDGENVLIPMTGTLSEKPVLPGQEADDYFRSCSELKNQINQSGNYMLQGKIQDLNYAEPLEPGIPIHIIPVLFNMDEEMLNLLPEEQIPLIPEIQKEVNHEEQAGTNSGEETGITQEEQTGMNREIQTDNIYGVPNQNMDQGGSSPSDTPNKLFTADTSGLFILEDPPEEGTPLYREEKLYFFQDPVRFLRETDSIENLLFYTLQGAALLVLLIALRRAMIPHVRLS